MELELNGARVLVSGGSRGIGRAILKAFVDEGASVSFCARGEAGVKETEAAVGTGAFGHALDITRSSDIDQWVESAATRMGGIDIIVPNVSALAGGGDLTTWRNAFNTDLLGTVSFFNAALPYLRRSSSAAVVLIASVSGREVDRFAEPYGVVKQH